LEYYDKIKIQSREGGVFILIKGEIIKAFFFAALFLEYVAEARQLWTVVGATDQWFPRKSQRQVLGRGKEKAVSFLQVG